MSAAVKPDLISVRDAAARLSINELTYRRGAAAGEFPPIVKVRGRCRVGVRALDEFIERLTSAAPGVSHGSAAVVETPGTGEAGLVRPVDGEQATGHSTPQLQEVPK